VSPDPSRDPIVDDPNQVVVNDKRRIDPQTGAVREAPADAGGPEQPGREGWGPGLRGSEPQPAESLEGVPEQPQDLPERDPVAELTADLQRVSAEYANYRKRVERDRVVVVETATAGLLAGLLPVLDDIDRARQHGDLTGAFKGVADQLDAVTAKLGLERYGEPGDPFDPSVHEALMQAEPDPAATVATCAAVLQPGYRLTGGRVLRPARVSVAEPGAAPAPSDG